MYSPISTILYQVAPFTSLLERARLIADVHRQWTEVYTRLNQAHNDDNLQRFFNEFSAANTLEQQAEVLARWGV